MDPVICCLLGICCPPSSEEQRATLENFLVQHFEGDEEKAKAACDEAFEHFAKGTEKLLECVKKHEKKDKEQ